MNKLVSLADLQKTLRIDHSDDDVLLNNIILQASAIVTVYINGDATTLDEATADWRLKSATLLVASRIYEFPEGIDATGKDNGGYLSHAVRLLLKPFRKPTLA